MKKIVKPFSFLLILVIIASVFFAAVPLTGAAVKHTVSPVCALNLRASASKSAKVVKTLSANSTLTLVQNSMNGWARVKYGSYTGYVSTAYLKIPSGSDVVMTAAAKDDVYIRKGKGTNYTIYTYLLKGKSAGVLNNTDEKWAYVKYGSYKGYLSKTYAVIRLTIPAAKATPKVVLNVSKLKLYVGGSYNIKANDGNGKAITSGLKFATSNKSVVGISAKGYVKAYKAGTATLTVQNTANGVKATCVVTVYNKPVAATAPTQNPTAAPTVKPTQAPTQAATLATTSAAPTLSISSTSATVYMGCMYQIIATSNTTVTWSSSNSSVASVSDDGIVTAVKKGTAVITAKAGTKSAACKISVVAGTAVSIAHPTASVPAGKTFLTRAYTSSVKWTSSNTAVATVNNGYILAKKSGKSVITVSTSKGAATMLVTVTAPEPIRFAYTSPNCAAKNQKITLVAITDTARTAVRFYVRVGDTNVAVNATSKVKDGNTLVWKGTTTLSAAGTYKVVAYSMYNNKWSTCNDGITSAFVANSTDTKTTVCTERRASDEVIALMANFEGYISSIYDDPITGDPTVGYGLVIFSGETFYNAMTKNEAFACLVQTVNNDGYASKVNSFLIDNKVKFNQQQFDALVCLVYNTGAGILTGDSQLQAALLNCADGKGGTVSYYINGSYVRIRKGAGTNYDIIKELDYGTKLTVLSTKNSAWYQVKLADGTTGYVCSDYISKKTTGGNLDLNYVNRQNLINKFCQYHHAAGECIRGLLYRRVDEMEMFFYGDYERNYGIYNYDINFKCANDPTFHT